jgi:site-specific DNA recombinase
MRTVLYLRMSTAKQEASIPQQRDALVAFAAKQGHEIVGEYVDEAISGDATHKRRGFQKMILDAAGGDFDRILCWDQSRFGRFDSIEAGSWIMPLRDAGVSLETIDAGIVDWQDFAGRITFAVAQEGKHAYVRDLSRSSLRGVVAKLKHGDGVPGGPSPYGYLRELVETRGRARIVALVPDPLKAPIVRRMFEEYAAAGGSVYTVTASLNRDRIPSPTGRGPWSRSTVRRLLATPAYRGDLVWGRRASGKYHARSGDEIVSRRRGLRPTKNVPIVRPDAVPALIDGDLYDRVQSLLAGRKRETRPRRSVRPLSGLLTCGCCGGKMHAAGRYYICSRRERYGDQTECSAGATRADAAIDAVASGLQKHILAPARLQAVKAALERLVEAERQTSGRPDATAEIERRLADLDHRLAEGVARIPLIPKSLVPELARSLDGLREQRDGLARQRDAMTRAQEGDRLPIEDRVAAAMAAAYGLRDALRSPTADPAILNNLLRGLGVKVTIAGTEGSVVVSPVVRTCATTTATRDKSSQWTFKITLPSGRPAPNRKRRAG